MPSRNASTAASACPPAPLTWFWARRWTRRAAATGKLASPLKGALPEKLGAMLNLLPAEVPPAHPLPELIPAQGPRRARVALLAGCVQQVLAPEINWATVRVLARNGVEVV